MEEIENYAQQDSEAEAKEEKKTKIEITQYGKKRKKGTSMTLDMDVLNYYKENEINLSSLVNEILIAKVPEGKLFEINKVEVIQELKQRKQRRKEEKTEGEIELSDEEAKEFEEYQARKSKEEIRKEEEKQNETRN